MAGLPVNSNSTPGAHRNLFCASAILETSIQRLLGPVVVELLCNASVQEVSANYDPAAKVCSLFADFGAGSMRAIPTIIPRAAIDAATRILATIAGKSLDQDAPFLNCVLASGFRYHAALWPVGDGPSFSIRTHARIVRPPSDFMSDEQAKFVQGAIPARRT